MRRLSIILSVLLSVLLLPAFCAADGNPVMLQSDRWDPVVRERLNELFVLYGRNSPDYNPSIRPYAVFDFDNTVSILDVEEQLAIYQLEHMRFAVKPEDMYAVLTTGLPDVDRKLGGKWGDRSLGDVARDAAAAYARLHAEGYVSAKGADASRLAECRASDDWKEFAAKARWLYEAIGDTMDASISYPWITCWFTGMRPREVHELACEAFSMYARASEDPAYWRKMVWESPDIPGSAAGRVSITFNQGITVTPEMRELFHALEANGFDVWICSASFIDVISAAVRPEIFGLEGVDGVLAMTNVLENGVYRNRYDTNFHAQTQGAGKVQSLSRLVLPLYNGRGPVLVAFDSQGDFHFATEYADTAVGLVLNRARRDAAGLPAAVALHQNRQGLTVADAVRKGEIRYLLQGRDENGGRFRPGPEARLLGSGRDELLSAKAAGWLAELEKGTPASTLINRAPELVEGLRDYAGYRTLGKGR